MSADAGAPGRRHVTKGPAPTAPHGTVSAYKRHLRHREPPCAACRAAWAAYHRDRYKAATTPKAPAP